jgi:protein-arginine deiminase
VGSIVNDGALRALNTDLQQNYITPVREQLMDELDLAEEDVVGVPGLFERVTPCPYSNAPIEVAALIPGMLNLVVINVEDEPLRIFVSDPFMRSNVGDQASDPLIAAFKVSVPAEYEIHHVDDWYTYHLYIGEVHCGTNVSRTPISSWWESGLHLLGGE